MPFFDEVREDLKGRAFIVGFHCQVGVRVITGGAQVFHLLGLNANEFLRILFAFEPDLRGAELFRALAQILHHLVFNRQDRGSPTPAHSEHRIPTSTLSGR